MLRRVVVPAAEQPAPFMGDLSALAGKFQAHRVPP
jgi:hypothetical protein